MWLNRHLKNGTKISMYRAIILATLIHDSESWVAYQQYLWLLRQFHLHCFGSIHNIHWRVFITNMEVHEKVRITSIKAMLLNSKLCWAGHISIMENHCLPRIMVCGELFFGYCKGGAPKEWFKDCLKKSISACHINHHWWFM